MKNCPNCKAENPDDAKFCGSCGYTFPVAAAPPPYQVPPPATDSGNKTLVVLLSIFVAPIGIIMSIIYMNDPNPEKKKIGKLGLWIGIGVLAFYCIIAALGGLGGGY